MTPCCGSRPTSQVKFGASAIAPNPEASRICGVTLAVDATASFAMLSAAARRRLRSVPPVAITLRGALCAPNQRARRPADDGRRSSARIGAYVRRVHLDDLLLSKDPGVGAEHVEPAEQAFGPGDQTLHGGPVGHVAGMARHIAARRLDFRHGGVEIGRAARRRCAGAANERRSLAAITTSAADPS